jgi:hypothetical protein
MTSTAAQFSMRQVALQWSLGIFVATPMIAILQGTYHLSEYRTNYSDAPRPVMPARGVAVAVERGFRPKALSSETPLRLLVVGDSLAAGVGMSKSGTPVLPESIARALSKAYEGRPVYWTCVGTPGVSASQIVQDIHEIEPRQPGRLERLFREWKGKRRKWQERQELRRRLTELEETSGDDKVDEPNRNYLKDWWETIRKDPAERNPKRVRETTSRLLQEWWMQVTTRLRLTRERVQEDLTEIKEIVQNPTEDENDRPDDLIHKGNAFRRDSLDPEMAAEYDIAVVLTGLNDLKDAFMPHMAKGATSSLKDGTERIVGGLRIQLRSIVDALETKMDLADENESTTEKESSQMETNALETLRRPLVVVPELPIAPLKLFHLAPLCWFLIPLFRAMENNKKFLSASFPEYVVFIPQPNLKWWSDVEAGLGPIRENIRSERLLLQTTDVTQNSRERIQELMRQFYYPDDDLDDDLDDSSSHIQSNIGSRDPKTQHRNEHHPHHPHHHSDHHIVPKDRSKGKRGTQKGNGSSYVAMDKMHPNDEGYELWGRHIAAAILQHRKR